MSKKTKPEKLEIVSLNGDPLVPFLVQDPLGGKRPLEIDPNKKYWWPTDAPTKKRQHYYAGGVIADVDFPAGYYRLGIQYLVLCDANSLPLDDVVEVPSLPEEGIENLANGVADDESDPGYDNLSDETHAAGSQSPADLVSVGADNTTRGPIDD